MCSTFQFVENQSSHRVLGSTGTSLRPRALAAFFSFEALYKWGTVLFRRMLFADIKMFDAVRQLGLCLASLA